MTDRNLLEAAAKAGELSLIAGAPDDARGVFTTLGWWNPLLDDGDALRLAVKLRLHVDHHRASVSVWVISWAAGLAEASHCDEATGDELADTRRAIVRAAASMAGK